LGGDNTLVIILIKDEGHPVLAMPLMENKISWLGLNFVTLQSLTNYHSYSYNFLLESGREDSIKFLCEYFQNRTKRWDLLELQEIPYQFTNCETLLEQARMMGHKAELWFRGDAACISISTEWEDYFKSLRAKFRSNIRNRVKRLNNLGKINYKVIDSDENIDSALARGFAIESMGWKGAINSAIACNPTLISFYTDIAKISANEKWLRLSYLEVGDSCAAFDYSLVYKNTNYCLKIGYDPEFKPYSVGQILCKENVKKCFDEKLDEYNFLGNMTTQKSDWASNSHPIMWLFIYNRTLLGTLHYVYKFLIKKNLKKLKSKK